MKTPIKILPQKKIKSKDDLETKINKLLSVLNVPETNCTFWKIDDPHAHIMGIRPIKRTTVEIINENGFNPYEKKTDENLFKCFKIFILENKEQYTITKEEVDNKKNIEKNGIIYIKSFDLIKIFDIVRKSS